MPKMNVPYQIERYSLEQGALEIQYIEEFFSEFPRRKTASEIIERLQDREHEILLAIAMQQDDPMNRIPVSFKVVHELRACESDKKLADLVSKLTGHVVFEGRKILYQWIGGTRSDWRGQGHFRALTEEHESWAIKNGFDEVVVKTKNKFYKMRATLDHLKFAVIKFDRNNDDNLESKVYFSKKLGQHVVDLHRSQRNVVAIRR